MPLGRALISAITLFGGHFLNRRLDRVVLFGAPLAVAVTVFMGVPFALFFTPSHATFLPWAVKLPLILVGVLALSSAALTFHDARQPPGAPLSIAMRISGAVISVVGALLLATVFVVSTIHFGIVDRESSAVRVVPADGYRPFYGSVSFGGGAESWDLPAPPSGREPLRGRITYKGAGVEGAKVALVLNSKYIVEHLTSNSRGEFEVRLPAGAWQINSINVSEWDGSPRDRNLVLFSGHEPKKGTDQYIDGFFMGQGLEIHLPLASNAIELEVRDAIAIIWPPLSNSWRVRRGEASVPEADLSKDAIAWQPVEAASDYEVQIAQVTREGATTRFDPILMRRLPGTSLPLASLPQRSVSDAVADEYAARIYAFNAEGKLVTESSAGLGDWIFKLVGATRLGKEARHAFGGPGADVMSAEYDINVLRLSLTAKLLDQKKFDEAGRVLEEITKDAPQGRVLALRGRLAAMQGDCVTADKLFDKAEAEGGAGCVRLEERKICAAPQKNKQQ